MTAGDWYRVRAAKLHAESKTESRASLRDQLEHLAKSYLRLAEQADRNALVDVTYSSTYPNAPRD
jgi:hypothetical protein